MMLTISSTDSSVNSLSNSKYNQHFWILVGGLTLIRLILASVINLVPQEAYYWLYIQQPALSYFDHPPLCSYGIGLFTHLFGNKEVFVRLSTLLFSIGTQWAVFELSKKAFGNVKIAFWSVVALNLTIFFNISAFFATPDSPLLFFWALCMLFTYQALFHHNTWANWILAGIFAGLAMYSKYTAVFLFLSVFCYFIISPHNRSRLWNLKPYISVIISFLVFFPVILWNANNHWASFLFQTSHRASGATKLGFKYLLQLVASQFYELTPLFFILLFTVSAIIIKNFWHEKKERYLFFTSYSLPMIIFFVMISLTTLVKMNWLQPAYLALIILITAVYYEKCKHKQSLRKKLKFGAIISLCLIILNLGIILFPIVPIKKGDTWNGWGELSTEIQTLYQEMSVKAPVFIFGNEYKIAAEMAFYSPYKELIYAQNIYNQPALQFDFWKSPHQLIGQNAIFMYSDFAPMKKIEILDSYFQKVIHYKTIEIKYWGFTFRRFYLYKCYNYMGPVYDDSKLNLSSF